ncbi:hypothetical protein F5882DRAFT_491738 [Hyaloscypha sp. PMI_1271]|nr:hypothetical protein F5882DRAFT_491738 [Hyaloscypha sp. PMI_1271]
MSRLKQLLSSLPRLQVRSLTLDTFTCFPRLPKEIRNKIWALAALEPRVIPLFIMTRDLEHRKVSSQAAHPAIVHVNTESREEGMRYYERVLEKCSGFCPHRDLPYTPAYQHDGRCCGQRIPTYINFAVDRFHHGSNLNLVINKMWSRYNFELAVLERIQNLTAVRISREKPSETFQHTHVPYEYRIPRYWYFPTRYDDLDLHIFLKRDALRELTVKFIGDGNLGGQEVWNEGTVFESMRQNEGVRRLREELEEYIKEKKFSCGIEIEMIVEEDDLQLERLGRRSILYLRITKTSKK